MNLHTPVKQQSSLVGVQSPPSSSGHIVHDVQVVVINLNAVSGHNGTSDVKLQPQ